ncbi:Lipoma HMGIC fusion partner-like 3 protein [Papilio xuthus]|uniref:Lipoma HMGIC fusion partner-like 3 protein n=1 Tax=Papilio xuthus TaxID=66420 RepID=A0A194PZ34_PAPXU|nr:Lipoma HMGIC fusion partner-like 3 protein [Papilio xuthus]
MHPLIRKVHFHFPSFPYKEKDGKGKRTKLGLRDAHSSDETRNCFHFTRVFSACLVSGVAVYPAGWSELAVQETCGPTADQYNIGRCHVRWAYLLAVIGALDGIVLAALAFILATRHLKLQPDTAYPPPSLYKGEVNNAYVTDAQSVAGSRKSLALQPVLLVRPPPDLDSYSHYSHPSHHSHHSSRTPRPKHGLYANAMHNYQL